jgi:hypothetical protein
MLRPVDIAVLLKLTLQGAAEMSFQQLASDLHLSSSEVHGSCKRSKPREGIALAKKRGCVQRTQANADGDAGFRSPPADFERRVEDEAGERTGRVEKHGLYVFE